MANEWWVGPGSIQNSINNAAASLQLLSNTGLLDLYGNPILGIASVASSVNFLTITNSIAGASPSVAITGKDTDIGMNLTCQGAGILNVTGSGGLAIADGPLAIADGNNLVLYNDEASPNNFSASINAINATANAIYTWPPALPTATHVLTSDIHGNMQWANALVINHVTNGVNTFTFSDAISGSPPIMGTTGPDTNISMDLSCKGTGAVNITGSGGLITPMIADTNGNKLLTFTTTPSSVNYLSMANSATGNPVSITAGGTDTNVGINIAAQGTAPVTVTSAGGLTVGTGGIVPSPFLTNPGINSYGSINILGTGPAGIASSLYLYGVGNVFWTAIRATLATTNAIYVWPTSPPSSVTQFEVLVCVGTGVPPYLTYNLMEWQGTTGGTNSQLIVLQDSPVLWTPNIGAATYKTLQMGAGGAGSGPGNILGYDGSLVLGFFPVNSGAGTNTAITIGNQSGGAPPILYTVGSNVLADVGLSITCQHNGVVNVTGTGGFSVSAGPIAITSGNLLEFINVGGFTTSITGTAATSAAAYTLPAGLPIATPEFLSCTTAGAMSWVGVTGTGNVVLATSPTIKTPTIIDTNNINLLTFATTASAVNYLEIQNNIAGYNPSIIAVGPVLADVGITLTAQNNGIISVPGAGGLSVGGTANFAGPVKVNLGGSIEFYNVGGTFYTAFTAGSTTASTTYTLPLAFPASSAFLTSTSAGVMSWTTSSSVIPSTATANQILLSGANASPTWSTSTYPATNAINTLLYASAANVMAALATANSGVLVTSNTGVPSISSILPAHSVAGNITINAGNELILYNTGGTYYASISGSAATSTANYTLPVALPGAANQALTGSLLGCTTAGVMFWNTALTVNNSNSGYNYITVSDAGTGASPTISSVGTSTNPGINLTCQGSGSVTVTGSGGLTVSTGDVIIKAANSLFLYNGGSNAAYYTALSSGATADATYVLPPQFPASQAFLSSTSAGIMSWNAVSVVPTTTTANQILLSTASGSPVWSTTTYPATNAINTMMYASAANVMTTMNTVNSAGLLTNSGGTPGWVACTGTGSPVLATSPTLVTPTLGAATASSLNLGNIGDYAIVCGPSLGGTTLQGITSPIVTGVYVLTNDCIGATAGFPSWQTMAAFSETIVTVGIVGVGVWEATNIGLAYGGTNASLTASAGSSVYCTSTALALTAAPTVAGQLLLSGTPATSPSPTWSTSTYPSTNAINTLLYASAANTMSALATANSGVLVTGATGVPSISSTLPPVTVAGNLIIDLDGALYGGGSLFTSNDILYIGNSAGSKFFIDRQTLFGPIIFGYNTPQPSGSSSQAIFQVYDNATSQFEVLEVFTGAVSGGTDYVSIPVGTASSSTSTGALVVAGGVGVGGKVYAGNTVYLPTLQFTTNNGLLDSNGNTILGLSAAASSVDYITITNSATNNNPNFTYAPTISVAGSDSSINLGISSYGPYGRLYFSGHAFIGFSASGSPAYDVSIAPNGGVVTIGGKIYFQANIYGQATTQNYYDTMYLGDAGNNFFLDKQTSFASIIFGYNTPQPSGSSSQAIFQIYDNATNRNEVFEVYTKAASGGSDYVSIPITTASSSTSTGALVVGGGVGISGALYTGGGFTPSGGILGNTSGNAASAGYVGEIITEQVTVGHKVTVTSGESNIAVIASISLTAGSWLLHACFQLNSGGGANTMTTAYCWVNGTSSTPGFVDGSLMAFFGGPGLNSTTLSPPVYPINLSTSATVYIAAGVTDSSGSSVAYGTVYAVRIR